MQHNVPRRSFGLGGIATRPTLGMVGDKAGMYEAMIPFKPSEGIQGAMNRMGMRGGDTYHITIGDIGGGVSKVEVETYIKTGIRESYKGFMDARRPD